VSTYDAAPLPPDLSAKLRRVHPRVRCHAHKKTGERCKNWAVKGGTVCTVHGASRKVRAAGLARLWEAVTTARVHALAAAARAGEERRAVEARALLGLPPDAPLGYGDWLAVGFLRAHGEAMAAGAGEPVPRLAEAGEMDAATVAELARHQAVMGELDALERELLASRDEADDGRLSQHHHQAGESPHCVPGQRPAAGADNHGYP